jgi:signal transduction histidine kinase
VQIRHVKNLPPIDFAVSDKEMIATIEKTEAGEVIRSLLVSNERPYIDHFSSIFEELWKHGIDARDRIRAIEEGVDSEGIEIIQNPMEIQELSSKLIKSATEEILIIFATANSFHRQEYVDLTQLLKEVSEKVGLRVRILTPRDNLIEKLVQGLTHPQKEELHQQQELPLEPSQGVTVAPAQRPQPSINIRYIRPHLQTKVSIFILDRKFSLIIELKDDTKQDFNEAVGLAIYSNSKSTVLSYASIFESLWIQAELYEQLKLHDKMQEEFINIAAHELRTPIQPLLMSSESLKRTMPDEERISIVIRNAKKLQGLANDILDVTRIESQTLKLIKENVNLSDLIVNAVKDTTNQIVNSKKVKILYEQPKVNNIFVEADRGRLQQVIYNLLNNAIKFTEDGTIFIDAERKEDDNKKEIVVISVKDSGIGIDREILPKLFSKFASKSHEGTGLGLFIAKSIVEAHGGKIWAKDNEGGKGATFSFSLPMLSSSS